MITIQCQDKDCGKTFEVSEVRIFYNYKTIGVYRYLKWHGNNKIRLKCKFCKGNKLKFK